MTARDISRVLDEIVWTVNPQNDTLEGLVNYICKYAQEYLAVAGGFAEVRAERVIILAEHAERPEEIDRERAERARQRAEMRLQGRSPTEESEEIDFARALEALARALTRLLVVGRAQSQP